VSQGNVDIVVGLQPSPDVDLVQLFGDEKIWAGVSGAAAHLMQHDFECAFVGATPSEARYAGADGRAVVWRNGKVVWAASYLDLDQARAAAERLAEEQG